MSQKVTDNVMLFIEMDMIPKLDYVNLSDTITSKNIRHAILK